VGTLAHAILSVDLNGDGRPDLVVDSYGENPLSVWLGNGDVTFQNQLTIVGAPSGFALVAGGFNAGGRPDLAFSGVGYLVLLLGNGDGTFQNPVINWLVGGGGPFFTIVAGDFNGDGRPDLATTTSFGGIVVLPGNGDGTFQPIGTYYSPLAAGPSLV